MGKEIYYKGVALTEMIAKYEELNNVWKVGDFFGLAGQYIHSVLTKHNCIHKMNRFTKEDDEKLLELYPKYRREQNLKALAIQFNRTIPFLVRQAKRLGLTSNDRSDLIWSDDRRRAAGDSIKKYIKEHGHPQGMLGKYHNESTLRILSQRTQDRADKGLLFAQTEKGKEFHRQKARLCQKQGTLNSGHKRCVKCCVEVGGKQINIKSSWEYKFALLCEYFKNHNRIKEWSYEVDTFDLVDSVVGFYKPDFKITLNDNKIFYIEVKGWFIEKAKVKMRDFRQQYPNIKLFIIDSNRFKVINKKYAHLEGWGNIEKKDYRQCDIEECNARHYSRGLCRKHYYEQYKK